MMIEGKQSGQEWEENKESLADIGVLGSKFEYNADEIGETTFKDLHDRMLKSRERTPMGEIKEITDSDLLKVLEIMKREEPELFTRVMVDVGDPKMEPGLEKGTAIFGPEQTMGYAPRITLLSSFESMTDDSDKYRETIDGRGYTIRMTEKELRSKLGDRFKDWNAKVLKTVVLLHEYGHAKHYYDNYKKSGISFAEAMENRREVEDTTLETLPAPGVSIDSLVLVMDRAERQGMSLEDVIVKQYFAKVKPGFYVRYKDGGYKIKDVGAGDLLEEQEKAYNSLPSEVDADRFMVDFLQKHWEELFPEQQS